MPKFDRYALGLPIIPKAFEVLDMGMLARSKKGNSQSLLVNKIDVELKGIQLRLRIANEAKCLPDRSHVILSGHLTELGKIVGGWIKKIESENGTQP
jgi:hypothetical protein